MSGSIRRRLWLILLLGGAAGLFWKFYPPPDGSVRLDALTQWTMGFEAVELPLTVVEKDFFSEARVTKRMYRRGEACFLLMIVDGTKNRRNIHDPMYYFRGAGWQIVEETEVSIGNGNAKWVRLERGGREKEVVYWFSDGQNRYVSPFKYWYYTLLRRLSLGAIGQEPVLVQMQSCPEKPVKLARILQAFAPLQAI